MQSPATAAQRALRTLTTPLTGRGRRAAIKKRLSRLPAGGYATPADGPEGNPTAGGGDETTDDDPPPTPYGHVVTEHPSDGHAVTACPGGPR